MKKILGISALVLLMGASAFAVAPYIAYTLELGGNDNASAWKTGSGPAAFTKGSDADGYNPTGSIITWAVRVNAGGVLPGQSGDMVVGGAANLVWDLQLIGPDGKLVGDTGSVNAAFGLGGPAKAGFFSAINDGSSNYLGVPDPTEAAAFAWAFGSGTPDRIQDFNNGGPSMQQITYPSTLGFPDGTHEGPPVRGVSTAKSGTLMGMGAGYKEYVIDPIFGGNERGGVGLPTGGVYTCALGGDQVVAEGQLNISGLKGGTYTLALIPGKGNNVIWNAANPCDAISGAFAIGVSDTGTPCANLCGDTITFTIPVTKAYITVNIPSAPAGAQWTVDGTNWNDPGVKLEVNPGSYTITFKDLGACWTAPAPIATGALVAGDDITKSGTYTAVGGTLAVAITPAGLPGAAWSIDGGATWNTAASLAVPAAAYTVKFAPVANYVTPADQSVTVACAQTANVSATYDIACQNPVIASAESQRDHKFSTNPAHTWGIPMPLTGEAAVECRNGGPQRVVLTYDRALDPAVIPTVALSAGTLGTVSVAGNQVTVNMSAVPNKTCMGITVTGAKSANGPCLSAAQTVKLRYRLCDVDSVRGAIGADVTLIRQQPQSIAIPVNASNFRFDVNCNDRLEGGDVTLVRQNTGAIDNTTCPN